MTWEPRGDVFKFKAHLNFSRRIKKIHTQENLKKDDLPHKIPEILTHRMVLSQLASLFDPLGADNSIYSSRETTHENALCRE